VSRTAKAEGVWVVTMESEHYTWLAVGRTREEALAGLRARWDKAMEGIPGAKTWKEFSKAVGEDVADYYGAHVRRVAFGKGYRDTDDGEETRP
jgi:hypothetical protein